MWPVVQRRPEHSGVWDRSTHFTNLVLEARGVRFEVRGKTYPNTIKNVDSVWLEFLGLLT